jgi:hypothetical protein
MTGEGLNIASTLFITSRASTEAAYILPMLAPWNRRMLGFA